MKPCAFLRKLSPQSCPRLFASLIVGFGLCFSSLAQARTDSSLAQLCAEGLGIRDLLRADTYPSFADVKRYADHLNEVREGIRGELRPGCDIPTAATVALLLQVTPLIDEDCSLTERIAHARSETEVLNLAGMRENKRKTLLKLTPPELKSRGKRLTCSPTHAGLVRAADEKIEAALALSTLRRILASDLVLNPAAPLGRLADYEEVRAHIRAAEANAQEVLKPGEEATSFEVECLGAPCPKSDSLGVRAPARAGAIEPLRPHSLP